MVVGSVALVVFLIFVFAAGKVLYSFKAARFTKAWTPLVPVIQGTIVHDGGGGSTSWLTGTYQGKRVRAGMMPDRNRYSGESGNRYNYFEVELLDVPGGQDWRVEENGRIETKDPLLRQWLEAYGLLAMVERFGSPIIRYSQGQAKLSFSEDEGPVWLPSPERFEAELGLLLQLAEMNREVNPAPR